MCKISKNEFEKYVFPWSTLSDSCLCEYDKSYAPDFCNASDAS
jgi:hypothetical protein